MRPTSIVGITLAVVGGAGTALGQEVLSSGPAEPVTPTALRDFQNSRAGFIPSIETSSTGSAQSDNLLRWSLFDFHPHALSRFTYGDGIPSSPGNKHTTAINEVQPGFLLNIGNHWSLDYTPTLRWYSNKAFRDSTDHAVTLSGGTVLDDWVISGSQSYRSTSSPLIETGAQTDQESYSTQFGVSRRFGSYVSDDLSLAQNFNSSKAYSSNKQWDLNDWLNFQVMPRLTLSAGLGGGYIHMDAGTDSVYEQFRGRISWRATDKLSLELNGGLEEREFCASDASTLQNPIYGASVTYAPFEFTRLSVTADRAVSQSLFQDRVNENTSVHADLNQRLLGKLYLNVGGGYRNSQYVASALGTSAQRKDDNYFYNARLSHPVFKRGTVAIFYNHTENISDRSSFAFTSDQIGFEMGYHF